MNDEEKFLSEEQIDFLTEMMNIGAGNAATALSQMLKCEAEMKIPSVRALQSPKVSFLLEDPSLPVACVRMDMVGDVAGNIFFIVPDEQKTKLIRLMERASGMGEKFNRTDPKSLPSGLEALQAGSGAVGPYGPEAAIRNQNSVADLSILAEIGNIIVGVYLTAVHDFCKLHLYHTVPTLAIDMVQSLIDESFSVLSRQFQLIIVIESEFVVAKKHIRTFLLMIPSVESMNIFVDSIDQARKTMRSETGNG